MSDDILFFIPARGGSERLPNKNLMKVNGIPLVERAVAQCVLAAQKLNVEPNIVVSTDSPKIKSLISKNFGSGFVVDRPKRLALPDIDLAEVAQNYLLELMKASQYPKTIVIVLPTAPLRISDDIVGCVKKFLDCKSFCDAVAAMTTFNIDIKFAMEENMETHYLKTYCPCAKSTKHVVADCGFCYVIDPATLLREHTLFSEHVIPYNIERWRAIDLDDREDLETLRHIDGVSVDYAN